MLQHDCRVGRCYCTPISRLKLRDASVDSLDVKHHGSSVVLLFPEAIVEGRRVLPRGASRAHGAGQAAGRGAGRGESECGARAACRGEGVRLQIWGGRGGEQRTKNIFFMFVTWEVSQPEMSALKLFFLAKR